MRHPLYVIGAGGHGKVVVSTLLECDLVVHGVLDDDAAKTGTTVLDIPVTQTLESFILRKETARAVCAVGENKNRKKLSARLAASPLEWVTVVHPTAWIHSSVRLGEGTIVFAGAVIQPDVAIGDHCIVNTGALIDHDCVIGDFCHLAPGCRITGGVTVGEGAFLGAGATVIPGITIGSWSVIGAGSTVIRDIPPGATAVGSPARIIKR